MKAEKDKLRGEVNLRLTSAELEKLKQGWRQSTCRSLSEYARRILTGGKVTILYRNQSFDDFMEEGIRLRKEMQAIRERGGLSKENEVRFIQLVEETKLIINKLVDICMPK